jgi:hypothetical protein
MSAAEDVSVVLHPMSDNAAAAMWAAGRESLNRTFEAIEHHGTPAHGDFEALVVIVAALLASGPVSTPSSGTITWHTYRQSAYLQPPELDGYKVSCH